MKIAFIQPRVPYYEGGGEKYAMDSILELASIYSDSTFTLITTKHVQQNKSEMYLNFVLKANKLSNIHIVELTIPHKFNYIYDIHAGEERYRWDIESMFFASETAKYFLDQKPTSQPDILWSYYLVDQVVTPLKVYKVLNLLGYPRNDSDYREAFISQFDRLVSINDNVVKKWNERLAITIDEYDILPLGIDFRDQSLRTIKPSSTLNVLFVGRLIKRKGILELCVAIDKLVKSNVSVHLDILGEGPLKKEIVDYIENNKLDIYVTLHGHVLNVADFMQSSDCCVFPSYLGEGQMSSVLEAMYYNGNVVTTSQNGNEDYIDEGLSGLLMPENSADTIVRTLLRFNTMTVLEKQNMVNSARSKVQSNTWSSYAKNFMKICEGFKR